MRTDRLIDILGTNLEPVKRGGLGMTLALALAAGGLAAFCLMWVTVGPGSALVEGSHPGRMAVKLLFPLSLIGIGSAFLVRSVRPGQDGRKLFALIFLPFLAVGGISIVALMLERPAGWTGMVVGAQLVACLMCISLFAVVPFAALIWAVRKGAPTHLVRTGAIAGVVAAAFGATAYALHGSDDLLQFIAVWYATPIALWAFLGAKLGPRLLRW